MSDTQKSTTEETSKGLSYLFLLPFESADDFEQSSEKDSLAVDEANTKEELEEVVRKVEAEEGLSETEETKEEPPPKKKAAEKKAAKKKATKKAETSEDENGNKKEDEKE